MRHRPLVTAFAAVLLLLATAPPALALPSQTPDSTWMVNDTVRSLALVGDVVWLGGQFTQLRSDPMGGTVVEVSGLAAVSAVTGEPVPGLHLPQLGGVTNPVAHDFSYRDGVLYVGGKFRTVDGASRPNLAALDPLTGSLLPFRASSPGLRAVLAAPLGGVYAGGPDGLSFYSPTGSRVPGFTPQVPTVLAGSANGPVIHDIVLAPDGNLLIGGAFDFLNGEAHRVAAKVDPMTGDVDDVWALGGRLGINAIGVDLFVDAPTDALYLAGGGSDFTARYRASDGAAVWKVDTSGAAQAVLLWDASRVVVGGHFQWIGFNPGQQCGSNTTPSGDCSNVLRLAALDTSNGFLDLTWNPDITPQYFGVWTLLVEGSRLHLGGQFKRIEGVSQHFYGRLS